MTNFLNLRIPLWALSLWVILIAPATADAPLYSSGELTLINGDSFVGQLRASSGKGYLNWQCDGFVSPFEFACEYLQQASFATQATNDLPGEFAFQFAGGDVIFGSITEWARDTVVISNQRLGRIVARLDQIMHVVAVAPNGNSLVRFLNDGNSWTQRVGWMSQGPELLSNTPDSELLGTFRLPPRFAIDLEVTWDELPDFEFVVADNANDNPAMATQWRLETVGRQLLSIVETERAADVAMVSALSRDAAIRLMIWIDRSAGQMLVSSVHGDELVKIPDYASDFADRATLRLVNRGKTLRVAKFRLWGWDGDLPIIGSRLPPFVHSVDDQVWSGRPTDLDDGQLTIATGGRSTKLNLSDLKSFYRFNLPAVEPSASAVFSLRCGSQISGTVIQVTPTSWVLNDDRKQSQFDGQLEIPFAEVHRVDFGNTDPTVADDLKPAPGSVRDGKRVAIIDTEYTRHRGWIVDSAKANPPLPSEPAAVGTDQDTAIGWQPVASKSASRLARDCSGMIQYSAIEPPRLFRVALTGGGKSRRIRRRKDADFGQLFLERVDRVEAGRSRRDQHLVHLVSGDLIACRMESIGQTGVYLSTATQDHVLIAHDDVKAIELSPRTALPEIEADKRRRLLTLPRLQKSAPPTHLLCSHDGDWLRGRLVEVNRETIRIEVQFEEIEIPSDRVSHLIWLHPSDAPANIVDLDRYLGLAQSILATGKRYTFTPLVTTSESITGTSPVLGKRTVELSEVQQILLGRQIGVAARKLSFADWQMTPATVPRIMQSAESSADSLDNWSLVGKPAPWSEVERMDGGGFELSKSRGKIVVLDFWASWCAPCVQTIPLLQKALGAYASDPVQQVSVNLGERRETVAASAQRLGVDHTVLLDPDGRITDSYRARKIPHTVVIDQDGIVAAVCVGGGPVAVEQVIATIDELLKKSD